MVEISWFNPLGDAPEHIVRGTYALLEDCDDSFNPPLSMRTSTCHDFSDDAGDGAVAGSMDAFFASLSSQPCLVAHDGERVLGLLSYKEGHALPFDHDWEELLYVTTVCTSPVARGRGIASSLYGTLDGMMPGRVLCLRTWSTNDPQLRLLERLGWTPVKHYPDDRGPGVDTVYLAKNHE